MNELLLSFVLPVYNVEKYIRPCLESLFNQDLAEEEFEVILVDDGCTDNTVTLIKEFAKEHRNIRLVHQLNQGPSAARNNGMRRAQGRYLMFVDSDDLLVSHSIRPMLEFAMQRALDILKAEVFTIDHRSVEKGDFPRQAEWKGFADCPVITGEEGFLRHYNPDASYVYMHLYRTRYLQSRHFTFFEDISFAEDVLFTISTYLKAARFTAIPYIHYIYRRHETSIMSTMNVKRLMCMNRVIALLHKLEDGTTLTPQGREKLDTTMYSCFSVILWYLSHYTSLYPHREEVLADLQQRVPNLAFDHTWKQRLTTFCYRHLPSAYITLRYLTARRKYNQ